MFKLDSFRKRLAASVAAVVAFLVGALWLPAYHYFKAPEGRLPDFLDEKLVKVPCLDQWGSIRHDWSSWGYAPKGALPDCTTGSELIWPILIGEMFLSLIAAAVVAFLISGIVTWVLWLLRKGPYYSPITIQTSAACHETPCACINCPNYSANNPVVNDFLEILVPRHEERVRDQNRFAPPGTS